MTIDRINHLSNLSRLATVSPLRPPITRVSPVGSVLDTPEGKAGLDSSRDGHVYYNIDGDSARVSDEANNLWQKQMSGESPSRMQAGPQQKGPGAGFDYELKLPSPFLNWDEILSNPESVYDYKNSAPSGNMPSIPVTLGSIPGAPADSAPVDGKSSVTGPASSEINPLEPRGECQTCANRRYVDQSDDPSVSYQTPTNISAGMSGAAVAAHESEHVNNERANALRGDREIISQYVSITYACCPECGRLYAAGGTTRTTSVGRSGGEEEKFNEISPGGEESDAV